MNTTKKYIVLVIALVISNFIANSFANNSISKGSDLKGVWHGLLKVPGAELRIVIKVSENQNGSFKATIDSPDQGVKDIPVDTVIYEAGNIKCEVKTINGYYEGKFIPDSNSIEGNWHQNGETLPLALKKAEENDSYLKGIWQGLLKVSGIELRIVFKVSENQNGGLKARLDSPDQGAKDIPIDTVIYNAENIRFEVKVANGYYEGKFLPDSNLINGTWHQNGATFPLVLKKTEIIEETKHSQEPKPPFPYKTEDVIYENKAAGIKLGGTLSLPESGEQFPAVLLITGSGQQNRDEELFGHKPFLVLADYLTRKGIAVLRVDDREIGESTGNFEASTTKDFSTDVLAGIEYLKTRKEINSKKIGLIGHSEGGAIAPMIASETNDVAFIVLMAGPGIPCDELLYLQQEAIAKAYSIPAEKIKESYELNKKMYNAIKAGTDSVKITEQLKKIYYDNYNSLSEKEKSDIPNPETQFERELKSMMNPWFRYFISYDPAPALEKVKCPVLAIDGSKDLQVLPEENLAGIKRALEKGGNKNFEIKELPGLNHLFQTAETGSPLAYAKIDETISPIALQTISDWILKTTEN